MSHLISVEDSEVDYYLGSSNSNVLKDNKTEYTMRLIYPFYYKDKNYVLINFDGIDLYGVFFIGEVVNHSQLITHCLFKLKSKISELSR